MSAPEVTGMEFPEHQHREYPKVVYPGGVSHDGGKPNESRTVNDEAEEAAAAVDGFLAVPADAPAAEPEAVADGDDASEDAEDDTDAPDADDEA